MDAVGGSINESGQSMVFQPSVVSPLLRKQDMTGDFRNSLQKYTSHPFLSFGVGNNV